MGVALLKKNLLHLNDRPRIYALTVLLVYRPPNSGTQNTDELCNVLDRAGENTLIIGDFNAPDIDWDQGQAGPRGRKIFTAAMEANMEQLVNFSTHSGGVGLSFDKLPAKNTVSL
jgi:hypothetical protein